MIHHPLPYVALTGTPLEQGGRHGEALRDEIAANIALYRARMRGDAGLSDAEIGERARAYLDVFTAAEPDYRSTMDGIAEGSGHDIVDIAMLNARFELLYSAWSAAGVPHDVEECTSFGWLRETSRDGAQWIGQNWDWFPGVSCALLTVDAGDGTRILGFTEAGIAGQKIGVNTHGVALCVNGLGSDEDDWARLGVPFHLRTWRALRSRSAAEAIGHITAEPVACSANFLVGDPDRVVDVELSPKGANEVPADPVVVHANHFLDPAGLGVTETWRTWPPTTFTRYDRMTELIGRGPVDPADLPAMLRDHTHGINALCRHPEPSQPEHKRIHTALSVLIDVDGRELSYTAGPPCESEYTTARL